MKAKHYSLIDLFAGIGGIRLGFEQAAHDAGVRTSCTFTSEYDANACRTYAKNFAQDGHGPHNDITLQNEKEIPDFDILLAGFPCQAFSIAGRRGGFEDTRGTLFFDVARIISHHRPRAFLLENVKGLVNHRGGKTLETILNVLREDLGYTSTRYRVCNARHFGVAQNRERIYMVGFRDGGEGFEFPEEGPSETTIGDIIEEKEVSVKYYLSTTYVETLRRHRARHESKGNGFGYEIKDYGQVANAIVVGGMGKERNLIIDRRLSDRTPVTNIKGEVNREGIRKMTPKEWERLQGFPDGWTRGVADVHRYRQLGNSVAVPVIRAIARNMFMELDKPAP